MNELYNLELKNAHLERELCDIVSSENPSNKSNHDHTYLSKEDDEVQTQSEPLKTMDASIETELHAVESYIDPHYYWNEWTARKDILKYAKLMNCKTKGSQTKTTYFRRDNSTQVYLPKENHSQTKRDNATNPKLTTTYLTGLSSCCASSSNSNYDKKDKNGVTKVTLSFDL